MMGMHGEAWVNHAIQEADLLIAVGMRFDDRVTGDLRTFDGINNINNPTTFKNITSHDLKLGVRWNLDNPPVYQPPLIRKG